MIKINGNCFINVEMEGLKDFNLKIFTKLIIKESADGVIPPIFELHLFQNNYQLYPHVTKLNKIITITYGTSIEDAKKYDFRLYNYVYGTTEGGFNLILTGFLDLKEFTNVPTIRGIKKTSDQVLNELTSVTPEIKYTGDDEQVWIQHNTSDKIFVEQVLSHAFTDETDFIAGALTVDKQLIVASVKKQFSEDEPFEIKEENVDTEPDVLRFDSLQVESDSALWSNFLSEGRILPVISIKDRVIERIEPTLNSIIDGSSYHDYDKNIDYPTIIDMGNCHDNYYKAWLNNLNYSVQFVRNNIYVFTSRSFLNNEKLPLLKIVNFVPNDKTKSEFVDSMSGKYLLTEKMTQITQKGFSHRLKLNRDHNL